MKRKKLKVFLYALSGLLAAGFCIRTVADYVQYTTTLNSAPFSLWVAMNALIYLLPAAAVFLAGWLAGRKTASRAK